MYLLFFDGLVRFRLSEGWLLLWRRDLWGGCLWVRVMGLVVVIGRGGVLMVVEVDGEIVGKGGVEVMWDILGGCLDVGGGLVGEDFFRVIGG